MAELINPTLRVQNLEGPHWLFTFEHSFNDWESVSLTIKVEKSDKTLLALELESFDRAVELLRTVSHAMERKPDKRSPG